MINLKKCKLLAMMLLVPSFLLAQDSVATYHESHRPQVHFSPKAHWMNDPNGMVYSNGIYHLFFQYYPNGTTWGPMHWGHAESTDLMHWKELPIALYPDSLGYIFSGSAVVDSNNTSGFGTNGKTPLVAIFTSHDPKGEHAGSNVFQNESIAYSLDNGEHWTKYDHNPVVKNPGIRDFRDPKVMWYAPSKRWIMTLATQDHISFFSSPDLKNWQPESEFGKVLGAHGGVWECPDLFPLKLNNKWLWVLVVNLNPGGPNSGSASQYFIGTFNGNKFTPIDTKTRWVDYGPDEYAGVTWSNTGKRRIFLGWMSNWKYAEKVPTIKWRSAMTVPRELNLVISGNDTLLRSVPVSEIANTSSKSYRLNLNGTTSVPKQFILNADIKELKSYSFELSNSKGERLSLGYDSRSNRYFIDRSKSGEVGFNRTFADPAYAPRFKSGLSSKLTLVFDAASVELFADDGLTVMTSIFFPSEPFTLLKVKGTGLSEIFKKTTILPLTSIW